MILDATEKESVTAFKGPKIPGYTILSRLGQGGMATVYLAIQESFGRKVALKIMMPTEHGDSQYGDRFLREAKIVAGLSHPHIVPVYDVGKAGDFHYISMEFLASGDLSSRIKKVLTFKEVISVTKDIALALDYAHRKGIIHRDVKPDNIMFREDGAAVLTDFGIARPAAADTNMTQVGKVIGTPKYMSPEQTKGETLDHTCDIYALGIMLYEMLTGNVPFDGKDPFEIGIKHLKDPVPHLPSASSAFQPLVEGLLAKNKIKRIQNGQEAIQILEALQIKITKNLAKKPYLGGSGSIDDNDKTQSLEAQKTVFADAAGHTLLRNFDVPRNLIVPLSIGAFVLLLSGAIATVWFAPKIAPDNTALMSAHDAIFSANPQTTEPATVAIAPVTAPEVEDPTQKMIEKNLNDAQVALRLGNYVTPPGQSALDYYRAILTIDADNQSAKLGIADLGTLLVTQANEAIQAKNFEKARELLTHARGISENIPNLVASETLLEQKENEDKAILNEAEKAKQLLAEQAKEIKKLSAAKPVVTAPEPEVEVTVANSAVGESSFDKVRITGLLAKGDLYFSRGDYYTPNGENALDKYMAILAISPDQSRARQGIEKLVVIMIADINRLLTSQETEKAKGIYDKAIAAAPNHRRLKELGDSKGW